MHFIQTHSYKAHFPHHKAHRKLNHVLKTTEEVTEEPTPKAWIWEILGEKYFLGRRRWITKGHFRQTQFAALEELWKLQAGEATSKVPSAPRESSAVALRCPGPDRHRVLHGLIFHWLSKLSRVAVPTGLYMKGIFLHPAGIPQTAQIRTSVTRTVHSKIHFPSRETTDSRNLCEMMDWILKLTFPE